MPTTQLSKIVADTCIHLCAVHMGDDLCVAIYGGSTPHLGAVATAQPRPSLQNTTTSATASVITFLGHKEDELARPIALTIASHYNCAVSVSCGIHIDNATPQELKEICTAIHQLVEEFLGTFPPRTKQL